MKMSAPPPPPPRTPTGRHDAPAPAPPPAASGRRATASPDPTATGGALLAGLVTSAVLVVGVGGWAALASIDGAILAEGQIAATRTRLVIQHPDGGRIAELAVADGQQVAAGDLLAALDPGLLRAERDIVESQYIEALARAARLAAERDGAETLTLPPSLAALPEASGIEPHSSQIESQIAGQRQLLILRRETLAGQIAQLIRRQAQTRAQRDGQDAQIAALIAESALIRTEREQQESLVERGLAPGARLTALRREQVRLDGSRAGALAERAALDGRITEIELQILSLRAGRREEAETALRDLGVTIVELATRRQLLDQHLSRLEVRAPAAGRVHALSVGGVGAVLRPAEPLAELIPAPEAPLATLRIHPEDADRLYPGQPVRVLLPASGGRDRPELEGRITQISADALEDPRSGQRHFSAEIAFDPPVQNGIDTRTLQPGLPVEAHIRTGARSPLKWFLAPLTAQITRALRED